MTGEALKPRAQNSTEILGRSCYDDVARRAVSGLVEELRERELRCIFQKAKAIDYGTILGNQAGESSHECPDRAKSVLVGLEQLAF